MKKVLFALFFFSLPLYGQVMVKSVRDFSGGMANGYSNAAMQDNTSLVLSNYDIVGGSLERRQGMGFLYADTGAPYIGAIFPYSHYRDKRLLFIRQIDSSEVSDTVSENTQQLVIYDMTTHDAETIEYDLFDGPWRNPTWGWAFDWTHIYHRLFMAGYNSDLIYVRDSTAVSALPDLPYQPKAHALNGTGNLNGRYIYKYCFIDTLQDDTSLFSAPSYPVHVENGKAIVQMDTAYDTTQDLARLYRKMEDSSVYRAVVTIGAKQYDSLREYTDNTAEGSLGAAAGTWATATTPTTVIPPGGWHIEVVTEACSGCTGNIVDTCSTCDSLSDCQLDYLIILKDSLGRSCYASPVVSVTVPGDTALWHKNGPRRKVYTVLTPPAWGSSLPPDIRGWAVIWRRSICFTNGAGYEIWDYANWRYVGLLNLDTTYSIQYDTMGIMEGTLSCAAVWNADSTTVDLALVPEDQCYQDSVLPFQPSIIEYHGDRLWAAGNPEYPDYLYYSKMGYPTTFASDYFVRVASQDGDAITGLLSIADVDYYDNALPADQMVIFKRNSVWAIAGFTFTDYRLSQLISGVGLVAERGYCKNNNGVFFVGQDGVYQLGQQRPISEIIQETVDSAKPYISRSVLKTVGDEIWWSLPVDTSVNNRTLVWSMRPSPHWTSYSFAMRDAIAYDTAQDWTSWTTDRALILTEADSIFRWNYSDADTLDGATPIQAAYQSKYFFDDPVREKILWIDLWGTGTVDTLRLIYEMNDGDQVDTAYVKPVFTDQDRDRIAVNKICENFSLRIEDYKGVGSYRITGYDIGYMVWDGGKK